MRNPVARRSLVGPAVVFLLTGLLGVPHAVAQATYREQQGSRGADTFTNYHNASGKGPRVAAASWVEVSCKVHDPTIPTANPDGYWYRIASSPWNNQYYAVANTFMNGDPWGGPFTHNTDFNVPDCGAAPAPPQPPAPAPPAPSSPVVTLARGPVAPHGYWYEVTLTHFVAGSSVSVNCRDSASPSGFRTFKLNINGSGTATTKSQCYSADGPDHWVVANGFESNHVSWAALVAPPNPVQPGPGTGQGPGGDVVPPPVNPGQSASAKCSQPSSGYFVADNGHVARTLYLHFLGGSGQAAVIEWSYFSRSDSFRAFAKNLAVGAERKSYRNAPNTNMFYALGSFWVQRIEENCYLVTDTYDFDFSIRSPGAAIESFAQLPNWLAQETLAKKFEESAVGQL